MKKTTFRKLLLLSGLLSSPLLFANDVLTDAGALVGNVENSVGVIISFGSFILGWALTLGVFIAAYYTSFKSFKEADDQDRSGGTSSKMTHAKAFAVGLIALVLGILVVQFIFHTQLDVGSNGSDALKKVLKIDNIFKGGTTTPAANPTPPTPPTGT